MFTEIPHEIIYSIPENHKIFFPDSIKNDKDVRIHRGIPSIETFNDGIHRLIIIDDQMDECGDDVVALFTRGSHHFNVSIILLTQNLFFANPKFRTMSLNAHYLLVFKNPRSFDQVICLSKQVAPGKSKFFLEAVADGCQKPHSYMLFDMTQGCPDQLRLRANIFHDDKGCTTVYMSK